MAPTPMELLSDTLGLIRGDLNGIRGDVANIKNDVATMKQKQEAQYERQTEIASRLLTVEKAHTDLQIDYIKTKTRQDEERYNHQPGTVQEVKMTRLGKWTLGLTLVLFIMSQIITIALVVYQVSNAKP